MPQSEMEALIQLQKEIIESLRQLVGSQRLTIGQMAESHEEQTTQLNQTIANLKKKLFASSSEKAKKDAFSGQLELFNEAEAVAEPSVPEPALEEAVGGYNCKAKKPKATREESLAGLPVIEVPCTVADEDRNCPYCNTPMEVIGKKLSVKICGSSLRKWNGSSMSRKFLAARNAKKTALPLSLGLKHQVTCSNTALHLHPRLLM